jgi:hypothetical protein
VSGNRNEGCNSILVLGLRHMEHSVDTYDRLIYCATALEGGRSLVTSYDNHSQIRVFRSSHYESIYRADVKAKDCVLAKGLVAADLAQRNVYRYDGLYEIVKVIEPHLPSKSTPFVFEMIKLQNSSNSIGKADGTNTELPVDGQYQQTNNDDKYEL